MALRICHELGAPVLRPTPTWPRRMFYLAALPVCAPTAPHGRSTSATAAKGSDQLRRWSPGPPTPRCLMGAATSNRPFEETAPTRTAAARHDHWDFLRPWWLIPDTPCWVR